MDNFDGNFSMTKEAAFKIGGIFLIVVVAVIGAGFFFLKTPSEEGTRSPSPLFSRGEREEAIPKRPPVNYVIQGVPPVTIYNHIGDNSHLVTSLGASIKSVLEFYGKTFSVDELKNMNNTLYDIETLQELAPREVAEELARTFGFEVEYISLPTIDDIIQYINEETQIPLLFVHKLTTDQPKEIPFSPMGVLIGVLEDKKEFVIHDYYLGYNKHISFSDFQKLRDPVSAPYNTFYFIIKPNDVSYKSKVYESYTERSVAMNRAEPLINKITLARSLRSSEARYRLGDLRTELVQGVLLHKDFEANVPPYYKAVAYSIFAGGLLFNTYPPRLKDADIIVQKAESINFRLDEPFNDFWPGFIDGTNLIHDVYDGSFFERAVLHRFSGDYEKAIESAQKALSIWPYGEPAQRELAIAKRLEEEKQSLANIRQSVNNEQMKKILIEGSPWSLSWRTIAGPRVGTAGTNEIVFENKNVFSGYRVSSGPLEDIVVRDGCVDFRSSQTQSFFELCLDKEGILRGTTNGIFSQGHSFVATVTANPSP